MNLNKAQVIGRVTQKPEAKALPNGTSVTSFTIATNHVYKKDGEKHEETEFHNIVAFAGLADTIARYVVKGQEIFIEGRLKTRSWEDKETSKKMYRTEIIADKMEFGQKPKGAEKQSQADEDYDAMGDDSQAPEDEINPEDIPF